MCSLLKEQTFPMTCVVYNGDEDVEDLRVSHIVDSRLP